MATLAEIQSAIDGKAFDPRSLSNEQRSAVDDAFKQGILKGYTGIGELEAERDVASEAIAKRKTEQAQPFTTATKGISPFSDEGITRADMEMVGDVGGSLFAYLQDKDKIMNSVLKPGINAGYGIQMNPADFTAKDLNRFRGVLSNLPFVKNFKLLSRTAGFVGGVADDVALLSKRGPTQLLATEAKSQLYGAAGAGAGSATFDLSNFATDFGVYSTLDLGEISDNEINKLPPVEQAAVHATEAMRNAIMFNSAASGLGPVLEMAGRGFKGLLGLKGENAEVLARSLRENKVSLSLSAAADPNTFVGKLANGFFKTIGVFPVISRWRSANRKNVESELYTSMLDRLEAGAPIEHTTMLTWQALPTMQANFVKYLNSIDVKYKNVFATADLIGDPRVIPTTATAKSAQSIYDALRSQYPNIIDTSDKAMRALTEFEDPVVDLATRIRNIGFGNEFITPKEYLGLNRAITRATQNIKLQDIRGLLFDLRKGLKEDFNTVANPANTTAYLNSSAGKEKYEALKSTLGEAGAQEGLKTFATKIDEFGKQLTAANQFFTTVVQPFNSPVAKQIMKTDSQLFTNKGIIGIAGKTSIEPDKMWKETFNEVFKDNNPGALKELQYILGTDRKDSVGKEIYDRMAQRYFWDAFLTSYEKKPQLVSRPFYQLLEEAERTGGIKRKYADEIYNEGLTKELYTPGAIVPEVTLKKGIGVQPYTELRLGADDVANFDVTRFKRNLGWDDSDLSKEKFIQLYGGGQKGREGYESLKGLINLLEKEYAAEFADASTFLQRRFTLGSLKSVAGGVVPFLAASSAGPNGVLGFALLGLYGGYALANPQVVRNMLGLFTTEQKLAKAGKQSQLGKNQYLTKLLNWAADEDKDFPKVDPRKINNEEIMEYLLTTPKKIPGVNFNIKDIRPELRSQFYPEIPIVEKSTAPQIAQGMNFLQGTAKAVRKTDEINMMESQASAIYQPGVQKLQPLQFMSKGQQPAQVPSGLQAAKFQALFPNDPLGNLIAQSGTIV